MYCEYEWARSNTEYGRVILPRGREMRHLNISRQICHVEENHPLPPAASARLLHLHHQPHQHHTHTTCSANSEPSKEEIQLLHRQSVEAHHGATRDSTVHTCAIWYNNGLVCNRTVLQVSCDLAQSEYGIIYHSTSFFVLTMMYCIFSDTRRELATIWPHWQKPGTTTALYFTELLRGSWSKVRRWFYYQY